MAKTTATTQRAYTLRLRGADPQDQSWREALWRTHEAVNLGAKKFGDWLLTLRGGLDHKLADAKIPQGKGKPDPNNEERKQRRILLALSWLSVESERGAPTKPRDTAADARTRLSAESETEASTDYIVDHDLDEQSGTRRNWKTVEALTEILEHRGLCRDQIKEWIQDCSETLSAAIRDDAVWVNRSKAFDEAVKSIGSSLTREEVWDMLERFFGSREAYLTPAKGPEDESSETEQEEKAKDLVKNAGQWLSSRFGTGKGADFSRMADVYTKIAAWAGANKSNGSATVDDLVKELQQHFDAEKSKATGGLDWIIELSSYPGHSPNPVHNLLRESPKLDRSKLDDLEKKANTRAESCRSKIGSKGHRPYADVILKDVESDCGFTYLQNGGPARHAEFAVMLDHAARRVSLVHTWIKRAEAERRRFEEDSKKLKEDKKEGEKKDNGKKQNKVPENIKKWLDSFCTERSQASGALEPYRIRRRAVDGWKEVVAAWSKPNCKTKEDRIAAARALQDDPEIDKFGDIQLFEALAEDDALCVWHKDGDASKDPDPEPLIDYALATEAEFKKRQFKVPAYRHPDALLHPVFCDFGCSRWSIKFAVHEAIKHLDEAQNELERRKKEVQMAEQAVKRAGDNQQKQHKAEDELKKKQKQLAAAEHHLTWLLNQHALALTLWTGSEMKPVPLCWQSKRLTRDLALGQEAPKHGATEVTRADRFGRAASNVATSDAVKIAGLFEEAEWNGRLQAPRQQLEAIARHVEKHGWDEKAKKLRDRIQWLVTFSAKLEPRGPWIDYSAQFSDDKPAKPFVSSTGEYAVKHKDNPHRKGHARLILSRLPGLRVLSVDLGHRYAAACAVWETLSAEQVKAACQAAGHEAPKASDLYLHLQTKGHDGKERTTIYRRIGADKLPDGHPHPAPWARLDRQFLIRLQGEEDGVREASNEEIWAVHQLETELGRTVPLIDRLIASGWGNTEQQKARIEELRKLGWSPAKNNTFELADSSEDEETYRHPPSLAVDDLMSSAVRILRLALKRHGDRARIAHYLITNEKTEPGGSKKALDETGRIELLQDALVLWHNLFSSHGWRDDAARQLWDDYVAKLSGYKAPDEISEESSGPERRAKQTENREKLRAAAVTLAQNPTLRETLHNAWKKRWEADDARWRKQLRWFKDWVLPRGQRASDLTIRKVGGLSLTRLATLTEFRRKVQVGFFTRLRPDGTKAETNEQFGQKALDALEHLREQRVKQLASRIVEAALGIGSENRKHWDKRKRPCQRIRDPRFAPCHAIVIENLAHYRPEETRTRRENRQLMTWSSSNIKKHLAEACQLNGLHLREVQAGYTSRQDSRTGAPGIRGQDVPVKEFMQSPVWRKQVAQAEKKQAEGKGDARDRFLYDLNAKWNDKSEADWEKAGAVRIPLKGGEIFVSADPRSPAAKGLQADLNAAANIGLKALTDPDWPGKWWYIPCDPTTFKPVKDKVAGSAAIDLAQSLKPTPAAEGAGGVPKKRDQAREGTGKPVNLWRDVSSQPISANDGWREFTPYWNDVQARVVNILRQSAGLPRDSGQ